MTEADQRKIRVLVVDDHELFREGVIHILSRAGDIEIAGEAEDGRRALEQCRGTHPDVVLMDINMPGMGGLAATRAIKTEMPDVKVLILTVTDAEQALFEAVKAGAAGYVLKSASPREVIDSVRRVSRGEPVVPGNLAMQIINEFSRPAPAQPERPSVDALTERELEVLRLLATGATNRDIARKLYISENTVRNHVRNILEKLHLSNRVQAAAYAIREGYAPPSEDA